MAQETTKALTQMATFSVYPATAQNIRRVSEHFGSVGRGIQVAVEILYERAQKGELFEEPDWDVIDDDLSTLGRNVNSAEARETLKVPFAFSILDRTEKLIQFLADPKYYGNRNAVILTCGTLLPQLYSDFIGHVLSPAERRQRSQELNAKLDAEVEAILGVDPKEKRRATQNQKRGK